MKINENNFAKRFRSLRRGTELTQEQFLKIFNAKYNRSFTASAISQYENGKRIPEIDALMDFADHFDVTVDYLLGKDTQKKPTAVLDGELEEDVVIFHRDGKNQQRKLTKEQMDMLIGMLNAIPEKPKDL